ncbi:c-type cytochrome [Brevundimonas subvibrioides]|uniref:Cytochrome c class I n=1 Tax=Brevundimonas subvibrioides (strain ATCC 15264 / DSM 4735 / LMG 14903 / NBRC 16000 / CB 81) TaxID=633149 RepID=D9QP43_BRESC|nr:cytochrome c [Brevundimonas subvibrioides]ADL02306.1 cytochrome c class I [Brevundimonas subvibrioides ATCC 15264]
MRLPTTAAASLLAGILILGCAPAPTPPRPAAQAASVPILLGASARDREATARGARIANGVCAGCHAVGTSGDSPHAAAPPLRDVVRRRSLEDLETAMAEGLLTPHPEMPAFAFRAGEIDDLIAYLETLRQDGRR